jgi:hypothetical protein
LIQALDLGIAACNIGGVTIHSFAGIGLGIDNADVLAKKVSRNKKATARWMRTKTLIIDEGAYNDLSVMILKPNGALIQYLWWMVICSTNCLKLEKESENATRPSAAFKRVDPILTCILW